MRIERMSYGGAASDLAMTRQQLRLMPDEDDEIELVTQMLDTATRELEEHAALAVRTQTIRLRLDGWPEGGLIELPIGPVQPDATFSVTANGTPVEAVDLLTGRRGALMLTHLVTEELLGAEVVVEYEAGFGPDVADVPADIAQAVLDQVAAHYDQRGAPDRRETSSSAHMARIAARYRGVRI